MGLDSLSGERGAFWLDLFVWTQKRRRPVGRRLGVLWSFCSLDILRRGLEGGEVVLLGLIPVEDVPPGFEVIGAAVLVVEVVGMFPHIESEDGLAFDAGDSFAHGGVVLVCGRTDLEFALVDDQPDPAGAEATGACGLELLFEVFDAAERCDDGFGEFAFGSSASVGREQLPEKAVVHVAAAVVANRVPDGVGHSGEIGDEGVGGFCGEIWRGFEGLVEVIDVGFVVTAVMDFHRLRIDVRLERSVCVRECGKFVCHRILFIKVGRPDRRIGSKRNVAPFLPDANPQGLLRLPWRATRAQ